MTYEELLELARLAQYKETGSLRPGDYSAVTRNASYHVGLLRQA